MNRKGFTLIELLIVVVIIGILAAIAIPKFANTKQKAIKSSMISDLRNLATAQEAFYADSTHYATSYGTTVGNGTVNFALSSGNVLTIAGASGASGWAATMANPGYQPNGATNAVCGLFVGAGFSTAGAASPAPTAGQAEGVPTCP
jgi:prepilin-type N-terminal cleavage/methylation domain-containing protein